MNVGEKIKAARKEAKLTQAEVGKMLGVSAAAIGQHENGFRTPKYGTLERYSKVLNKPIEYFLGCDLCITNRS